MIAPVRGPGKLFGVWRSAALLVCVASCEVPDYSSSARDAGAGVVPASSPDASLDAFSPGSVGYDFRDGSTRDGEATFEPCAPNGQRDFDESDIDCGGDLCPRCEPGKACARGRDCLSGVCREAVCGAAECNDGVQNGDEADVDCGGSCSAQCSARQACRAITDCAGGLVCTGSPPACEAPTCANQLQDGAETDVDCGGPKCRACPTGALCVTKDDCSSGVCSGWLSSAGSDGGGEIVPDAMAGAMRCQASSCSDGVKNGSEVDKDCGGSCPVTCRAGRSCSKNADCRSGICSEDREQVQSGARYVCQPGGCDNGVRDGTETGVDCGGTCSPCSEGSACAIHADCLTGSCQNALCVAATCNDGLKNGNESDADCGGTSCGPCAVGKTCREGSDCESLHCTTAKVCGSEACDDGIKNQDESAVDCGGRTCPKCADGSTCAGASDCQSGVCTGGQCQLPTCSDGVANGSEPGVDCGGPCVLSPRDQRCAEREPCFVSTDCAERDCHGGFCQPASCTDGVLGSSETDLDCGGSCKKCANEARCGVASDCLSGVCNGTCQTPTCQDGVRNGAETDIDCGGGSCTPCPGGKACSSPTDCQSRSCVDRTCQAASCSDQIQNQGESSVDCGGVQTPACARCPSGKACGQDSDCASLVCGTNGRCAAGSCTDGVQNQDESDVDCGGTHCNPCDKNRTCLVGVDCRSSSCVSHKCADATCSDGVQNGTETASDCGGSCASAVPPHPCSAGMVCGSALDCSSSVCTANSCQAPRCQPSGDSVKNGTETDVDCGGAGCPKCADGKACLGPSDCSSGVCSGTHCAAPSCVPADLTKNGAETDVDCGGSGCPTCADGKTCRANSDCASGVCSPSTNQCQAPKCPDLVRNQGETDIDCGGPTCTLKCPVGKTCGGDSDCVAGSVCIGGSCKNPACDDGKRDGLETDLDCGGATCRAAGRLCVVGQSCAADGDCAGGSGATCLSSGKCSVIGCADGRQNLDETDVDCGGGTCAKCADGKKCSADSDCTNNVCNTTCKAQGCSDARKDGYETDVDCGGTACPKCPDGKVCQHASDCASGVCTNGKCQVPRCPDGVQNQAETDTDCGGSSCPTKCPDGDSCLVANDCLNGVCYLATGVGATALVNTCQGGVCRGGTCRSTACSDGLWGGNESDTDCGGSCTKCPNGKKCNTDTDCNSNVCHATCQPQGCAPGDSRKNGTETDVDCGGTGCPGCPDGQKCLQSSDCINRGRCASNICQPPTCSDGLWNQSETDVDCGGAICNPCDDTKSCVAGADCRSGVCNATTQRCSAPTCDDHVQNHGETDLDCGGTQTPSCPRCALGAKCSVGGDCLSGVCGSAGLCVPSPFQILYRPFSNDSTTDGQVYFQMKIVNGGSDGYGYDRLKVRYWFLKEGTAGFEPDCYWWAPSSKSSCGGPGTGSELLNMNFFALSPTRNGADEYLEVTFSGSSVLGPGSDSGEMQLQFNHPGWTPFNENNHYSYRSGSSYAEWSHITLYLDGTLVWGTEP